MWSLRNNRLLADTQFFLKTPFIWGGKEDVNTVVLTMLVFVKRETPMATHNTLSSEAPFHSVIANTPQKGLQHSFQALLGAL